MNKTYIIAEAGVNHNGSIDLALKLVEEAAHAGADAVKFQTFITNKNISPKAEKADYQKKTTNENETQYEMVRKLELTFEEFKLLQRHCEKNNITFLSTGFDLESLDFLINELNIPYIKIPSGDITNAPLILKAAQSGKEILLSTGMCNIEDIHNALAIIYFGMVSPKEVPQNFDHIKRIYKNGNKSILKDRVTILQCTTEYPTPPKDINLKTLVTFKEEFGTSVGFSDHSEGTLACSLAVALGASIIEKHFTLDKEMEGPDHRASLEPSEFNKMVEEIRFTEKSLGSREKKVSDSEKKNIMIARKSLVAEKEIAKSEAFTAENLSVKRPGNGLSPIYYWDCMNHLASKNYFNNEQIESRELNE